MIDIEPVAPRLLNAVELYGSLRLWQLQNRLPAAICMIYCWFHCGFHPISKAYSLRVSKIKERELEDPDDILIKAERRNRELAREQEGQDQEPKEGQ